MYVIHKKGRLPRTASDPGAVWDRAGLRDRYKTFYNDKEEAETLVIILSTVGYGEFEVSERKSYEKPKRKRFTTV